MKSTSPEPNNKRLFLSAPEDKRVVRLLRPMFGRLPALSGLPITLSSASGLRVSRGRLRRTGREGLEVHAAASVRLRRIVLHTDLLGEPEELERIFTHELFHFAWVRLSNARRREFESVLADEFARRARGELGWSAQRRKETLCPGDSLHRTRPWREYVCESFCDTAAWLFSASQVHDEFTLALGRRRRRGELLRNLFGDGTAIAI